MKKLIQGILDFRKNLNEDSRALFGKLALGQKPDVLFIACSDSRVVPNLFASTNPGDLFVLRNVGNIVPPMSAASVETSIAAAIEFAIFSLNVSEIVICGHSECGAMQTLSNGMETGCCIHLKSWLRYAEGALDRIEKGFVINPSLSRQNQISQINVLEQMQHVLSYSYVREKVEHKQLRVHGWWFDIAQADVYCYEQNIDQFVLIDEKEAQLILQRLQ